MGHTADITSFERIGLDELRNPVMRRGVDFWLTLKGSRRFPARSEVHPRDIRGLLNNLLLIRVIDAGADFQFRIAGEAQIQTYALSFAGKCLSELKDTCPAYGYVLKGLFGFVTAFAQPVALRGSFGAGFPNVKIAYCETAFMPLGTDQNVDHLLGFTAFIPSGLHE